MKQQEVVYEEILLSDVLYEEDFENLPDDWLCICGMRKESYEAQ